MANGMFWLSRGIRFFSPWPSYKPISLSSADRGYLWRQGAFFAHYVCSDDQSFFPGYDLIVDDRTTIFGNILSPKRRHNIRWALKHCSVERISFESLVAVGRRLIEDTHKHQERSATNLFSKCGKITSTSHNPILCLKPGALLYPID